MILFAQVFMPDETADLFRTAEPNVAVRVLPFEAVVFT
jgi:hypothetical protein